MEVKILITLYLVLVVDGYFMDNDDCPLKCYCGVKIVTCDEAINPVFRLNWKIETFYMENSHLNNLKDVINSFRNLKYLTLKNMASFNCSQLLHVPTDVIINVADCEITTDRPQGKIVIYCYLL